MKKGVIIMLIAMLIMSTMSIALAKEFPDVPADHWALKYIDELSDKGVINGYDDGTYQPSGTVKRGEFIKLVVASVFPSWMSIDEIEGGIDHWAGPYLKFAEMYSLIDPGTVTLENIDEPITRMEMARLVVYSDVIILQHDSHYKQDVEFLDIASLPLKDVYVLSHATNTGLITGYEDNTFKPEQTMTRAEAATMIWRFNNLKGE